MRLRSVGCFLVLLTACQGSDEGGAQDAAPSSRTGEFVISTFHVLADPDVDGDGTIDNSLAPIGANPDLTILLGSGVEQGIALILAELVGVDSIVDDPSLQVNFYLGLDTDNDPSNNHMNALLAIDPTSVDANGDPLVSAPASMAGGVVQTNLEGIGAIGVRVVDAHIEGTIVGDLDAIRPGQLTGTIPAWSLAANGPPDGLNSLDVIVFMFDIQPDVDLDGGGLERYEDGVPIDEHVDRCIDEDGTVVDGPDCAGDPRFADGYSLAASIAAEACRIQR